MCLVALACSQPSTMNSPDGGGQPAGEGGPFLAVGERHTCVMFEGAVRCWGDNNTGQLGRPPFGDPLANYSVDLGRDRRAIGIYTGQYHTCALLTGGAVKCWGDNSFGHLGLGDLVNRGDGLTAMGDGLPVVDLGTGERAVALALGGTASCALLEGGRVKCWGDPYLGATGHGDAEPRGNAPGTMGDNLPVVDLGVRNGVRRKVKAIEAFEYHSFCVILEDSESDTSGLKCWGSNDYCELGLGLDDSGRGMEPGSMGDNLEWIDIGTTASGAVRKAVAMAAGFQSICVLGDDGVVKCWGSNRSGEAGIGALSDPRSCVPEDMGNSGLVSLPGPAVAIGARMEHACALLASGQVICWGVNRVGQLGTGDIRDRLAPAEPLVLESDFQPERLVLGNDHGCVISTDKRVKCWGSDQYGQLGAPVSGDLLRPGPDLRQRGAPVDLLAAGDDHTCALLRGGSVKCWGRNSEGQLGTGDTLDRGVQPGQMGEALHAVALEEGATAVAAGAAHTCVVLAGGGVTCWGAGGAGQLGRGDTASLPSPGPGLDLPKPATALALGADFSCALLVDGRVLCWGAGERGQLGTGDTMSRFAPGPTVALPAKATAIAAGAAHACARLVSGGLHCWGANGAGQLGVGDTVDRTRATAVVLGARTVEAVASRIDSTCVLRDDHRVTCWGLNADGQLGLGDTQSRSAPQTAPIDLGVGRNVAALAVGGAFGCGQLDTGQAICWGGNTANQLGAFLRAPAYGDQPNEMGDFLSTAYQGGGRSVRAVVAGRTHACVILDTKDVRCWGDNGHGQLGIGDAELHSLFLRPTGVVDLGQGR
jgi:alpha-tubulin suppressor-like RCC1 family protein